MLRIMTFLLALCLPLPALAGPFEDGEDAYWRGDYETALRLWRPLAEQGNARAQFNVGSFYRYGVVVPQDYAQAIAWYRKSAEQGNADAQRRLGDMYWYGHGVPTNYVQAHMWFNLAASREKDPEKRSTNAKARDALAANMTREQIARAQQLAREWKPKGQ